MEVTNYECSGRYLRLLCEALTPKRTSAEESHIECTWQTTLHSNRKCNKTVILRACPLVVRNACQSQFFTRAYIHVLCILSQSLFLSLSLLGRLLGELLGSLVGRLLCRLVGGLPGRLPGRLVGGLVLRISKKQKPRGHRLDYPSPPP